MPPQLVPPSCGLRWADATRADVADLHSFVCTDPPKPKFVLGQGRIHPASWEYNAQSAIRSLKAPCKAPDFLLLARDRVGLAVVFKFEVDYDPAAGLEMFIQVLGVAHRVRGSGYAVAAFAEARRRLGAAFPVDAAVISAHIHPDNRPSQTAAARAGLRNTREVVGKYEVWDGLVPLT